MGCGSSEPVEISAANSGYMPQEASQSSGQKASPTNTMDTDRTSSAGKVASNEGGTKSPPAQGNAIAPAVPTFEPGQMDPKIAAKEYMQLKMTEEVDAVSLMKFLEKSSRAVRELIADGRRKLVTRDVIVDRGMQLSRMKIAASDLLNKIAKTEDEKVAAAMGKMEALAQMTGFGDVPSSDELRDFADQETNNSDPRIAQQAKSISLGMLTNDFENGTAKLEAVTGLIEKILENGKSLVPSNLAAISQALASLDGKSEKEAALLLAKKTEEGSILIGEH